MKKKYENRRNFDEALFRKNLLQRKIAIWLAILVAIPFLLFVSGFILHQRHYLIISLFVIIVTMVPFFVSFEYRALRAREIVLLAMMVSFCVAVNLLCSHTIPLHGGSAMVVLTGIALGPEAGFLTGALGRFLCNFFDGQGPWTPWQMASWGLIGFVSGAVFVRYRSEENKTAKKGSYLILFAAVLVCEVTGYLWLLLQGGNFGDMKGWMLYAFGMAGLVLGGILQRKRLPTDTLVMTVFTFLIIFILYGGIMNFATMVLQTAYTTGEKMSLHALKALYITGVPYDTMHGAGAALCVFLMGEPFLKKLERVQIKYGIYRL